ncbi:YjbQ family protein [Dissulfurirhabdus thermomarina]|uniref:YjbQ family protein n=2 Tax=Dissulfurirhabdus thermomarina TaxID=1765737 RepID=A0A6N9TQS9_DISTH|nr:YjbQ family protein [Dissulfurirhabdus thermomarina]NMX23720.1 YjbQ family protein [Dissulfurirhabdus thermomarina]
MVIRTVQTRSRTELVDITGEVEAARREIGLADGLLAVYVPHTTAGVTINEGADPAVRRDVMEVLNHVVPWDFDYRHMEGNSPAHVKATLTGASVHVLVEGGRLLLGTWQRVFLCEFDGPRNRKIWVKGLGA